ncbi:MAG: MarR family transcriptional regulator [Pseudomonadota bacterium]
MSASKHRLYFLLQRAAHRLKTEADASLTEVSGLTTAQSAVMTIIARRGPMTQKEVADTLSQRESAVTAMAGRLIKAGLVARERSSEDARAWQLTVTDEGTAALKQVKVAFDKINAEIDQRIPEKEMNQLADNLSAIIEAFDQQN